MNKLQLKIFRKKYQLTQLLSNNSLYSPHRYPIFFQKRLHVFSVVRDVFFYFTPAELLARIPKAILLTDIFCIMPQPQRLLPLLPVGAKKQPHLLFPQFLH